MCDREKKEENKSERRLRRKRVNCREVIVKRGKKSSFDTEIKVNTKVKEMKQANFRPKKDEAADLF